MKYGFTLIELLIAISITGLLLAVSFAGFKDFTIREQVDNLQRSLLGNIRGVQSNASAGVKPTSGCTGAFVGYRITFTGVLAGGKTTATSYTINAVCPNTVLIKTVNLPANQYVSINRNPGTINLTFKALESGTDIPDNSPFILTASNAQTTRTISITITSKGDIN